MNRCWFCKTVSTAPWSRAGMLSGEPTKDASCTPPSRFALAAPGSGSSPPGRCIERKGPLMAAQRKPIPEFRSEEQERAFWSAPDRDSTEYLDWSKARLARFPNVKLSTQAISLRLPVSLLERIKLEANKRDVPYQSLIKVWLMEKVTRR